MIENVTFERSTWAKIPTKFEAGTQPILEVIGLGAAIDYVLSIGYDILMQHDKNLVEYALIKMRNIPGLSILGSPSVRGGVISFSIKDIHAHDIATLLDQNGIAIRAGQHCAEPLVKKFGYTSVSRASFAVYTTFDEIDKFVDGLNMIIDFFQRSNH